MVGPLNNSQTLPGFFLAPYSGILVKGFIIPSNQTVSGNAIYFEHKFVTNYDFATGPSPIFGYNSNLDSYIYSFEDQTQTSGTNDPWSPSGVMSDWESGGACIDGTWDGSGDSAQGWYIGPTTGFQSSGTGPSGGVDVNNDFLPNANFKYLYTESSTPNSTDTFFITRTPSFNLTELMSDTSADATLCFYLHAVGANLGTIRVYIDDASTSNTTNATLLTTLAPSDYTQTSTNSPYQKVEVSLNAYRTIDANHYIYFTSSGGSGFSNDIAIDRVYIQGAVSTLNFEEDFVQYISSNFNPLLNDSFSLALVPTITVENKSGTSDFTNPIVSFNLSFGNTSSTSLPSSIPYIKGSYLLL